MDSWLIYIILIYYLEFVKIISIKKNKKKLLFKLLIDIYYTHYSLFLIKKNKCLKSFILLLTFKYLFVMWNFK